MQAAESGHHPCYCLSGLPRRQGAVEINGAASAGTRRISPRAAGVGSGIGQVTRFGHALAARLLRVACLCLSSVLLLVAMPMEVIERANAKTELAVVVHYLQRDEEPRLPLSLIDSKIEDEGIAGLARGLSDNATTGRFLGHQYSVAEHIVPADQGMAEFLGGTPLAAAAGLVVANLEADDLLAAADALPGSLLLNVRAGDASLRSGDCRSNVLHIAPSRYMLADALAQYLVWKRWEKVVLVTGRHPNDQQYADALRRAAERYRLKVVAEKDWTREPGARRTDSGHHSAQQEIPAFTEFREHDVLLVADELDEFGEYLPYRTRTPRPVAGTQGLMPTAWHRSHEQWGATQIQHRFEKDSGRSMTVLDYNAWAAMRVFGEAVTNTNAIEPEVLREYIFSAKFKLAGFKGVPLTFRQWNGQMRQPVLLAAPRMLISVSPQQGFLHEHTELDTLGLDEPESDCKAF